jgi:hypothetical protein
MNPRAYFPKGTMTPRIAIPRPVPNRRAGQVSEGEGEFRAGEEMLVIYVK